MRAFSAPSSCLFGETVESPYLVLEPLDDAATRGAYEEAGLRLNTLEAIPVYEGIVHDARASRHSWVTTSAFLWRTCIRLDQLSASDDAQDIRLADLADIRSERLYGSHSDLIEQAIARYGTPEERQRYGV